MNKYYLPQLMVKDRIYKVTEDNKVFFVDTDKPLSGYSNKWTPSNVTPDNIYFSKETEITADQALNLLVK